MIAWNADGSLREILRPNGSRRSLAYEALTGRLESILEKQAMGSQICYRKFTYTLSDQIESITQLPQLSGAVSITPATMTYDADNRVATFDGLSVVHDDDGNMTTGPLQSGASFQTFSYDTRNRLTSVGAVGYGYDAEGNRISMTTATGTTQMITDPHSGGLSRVLVRKNPDGSWVKYIYGLGLEYEVSSAGQERYYHFDQLGSTVALTDENCAVTDRFAYGPYGEVTYHAGSTDTPFQFVGRLGVETDPNGLCFMRARYYSPVLRRFINADPIRFGGGLNWYGYCGGDPLSFIDPNGMLPDDFSFEIGEGVWVNNKTGLVYKVPENGQPTLGEANNWYRTGNGIPMVVDPSSYDFSNVDPNRFDPNTNSQSYTFPKFDGILPSDDFLVNGTVTVKLDKGSQSFTVQPDRYDFDMHSWSDQSVRNIETIIGNILADPAGNDGVPYQIIFDGSISLRY
jgi:RHS repeat-associated protein